FSTFCHLPQSTLFPYTTLFRSRTALSIKTARVLAQSHISVIKRASICAKAFPSSRQRESLSAGSRKNCFGFFPATQTKPKQFFRDRKSTRLNSSHVAISYAVFC